MAGTTDPYGVITPDDFTYFAVQRRRVNDTYNLSGQQNNWQGTVASRQKDQALGDLKRKYEVNQRRFTQPYAKRGLLNSGLVARGRYDMEQNNLAAQKQLLGNYNDQMGSLWLAGMQLGQTKDSSLSDIDMQEQARRATAQAIRAGGTY